MPAVTKRLCNSKEEEIDLRRGPWTLEEDTLLIQYIARHGEGRWNMLAKCAGLRRTGKSCRLRWLNYLKPDIKRGNLTPQEQLLILELHSKWGNRWSKIAAHLPGRTDNEIKNYWRTRVQKQARQLNIESNSTRFLDAVRRFWMPRLLQKMEQTSASSSTPSSLTNTNSQNSAAPFESHPFPPPSTQTCSLNHPNHENSNSSSSSVSMTTTQMPEISESTSSDAFDSSFYNTNPNPILSDVDTSGCGYGMEGFSMDYMSAIDTGDISPSKCHVSESNWMVNDDMANILWHMDDMWQLREFEEMGI